MCVRSCDESARVVSLLHWLTLCQLIISSSQQQHSPPPQPLSQYQHQLIAQQAQQLVSMQPPPMGPSQPPMGGFTQLPVPQHSMAPPPPAPPRNDHLENQIMAMQAHLPPPPPPPGSDETCGLSMMNGFRHERIVGGWNASYAEAPFIAHLKESQMFRILGYNKCGGCLLNHRFALTAGHCKPAYFSSLEIILGKQKTFEDAPPPEGSAMANIFKFGLGGSKKTTKSNEIDVDGQPYGRPKQPVIQVLADTFIVHPDYDAKTLENDIALIKFKESIPYREDIQPICLPGYNEDFTGLDGYATGWGLTDFDKRQLPETLQVVRLPIMHNKRCQSMYKKAGHDKVITDFDLCAGYAKGGMDACEGDSGGPLVVRRPSDHRWTLAGIVSNGVKCGEPLLPGVYTRVSKFVPWIMEQMRLHS